MQHLGHLPLLSQAIGSEVEQLGPNQHPYGMVASQTMTLSTKPQPGPNLVFPKGDLEDCRAVAAVTNAVLRPHHCTCFAPSSFPADKSRKWQLLTLRHSLMARPYLLA